MADYNQYYLLQNQLNDREATGNSGLIH